MVKYKTKTRTARFWANTQCYKTSKISCWSVTYKKQPCFDIGLDFVQFTHFHDPFYTQALVRGANTQKYPNIEGGRTRYQFFIWNFYFNTYIFYKNSEDFNRNSASMHTTRFNSCHMENILIGGNKTCSNDYQGFQNGLYQYCFRKSAKNTTKFKTIGPPSDIILRKRFFSWYNNGINSHSLYSSTIFIMYFWSLFCVL